MRATYFEPFMILLDWESLCRHYFFTSNIQYSECIYSAYVHKIGDVSIEVNMFNVASMLLKGYFFKNEIAPYYISKYISLIYLFRKNQRFPRKLITFVFLINTKFFNFFSTPNSCFLFYTCVFNNYFNIQKKTNKPL